MDPTSQFMLSSGAPVRRRKTDQGSMNPIEATVTKLLVATKQLLEGLTLWSTRKMGEEQVSDIFVQLATQFNMASQAFHEVGIDTSELAHIPDDLRNCLETALGEDPSPSSLDQYLPRIKEVIINLLQGLRLKQNLYREQHEAKTARIQAAGSARSKSSGSTFRQPSTLLKPPEDDVTPRNSIQNVAPSQPYLQPTARDEQGHAETLASLRKSDAITRRASSRRHSQRFSTLIEQNTPPVPRRNHMMDPGYLSAYPGYTSGGSQGSTPATSPNPAGYGQSPQMPMPEPYVSGSSSSSSRN
ncbi:Bud site selection protein 6, partial [Lunasporangiospora selenospora]